MTMECREFKIAYLEECSSLYVNVFKREPWNEDNSLEDVRGYFLALLEMNTFFGFVLMCGDHVVGVCVGYIKPYIFNCSVSMEYEIEQFFIANDYQNRGYGRWFLETIIQQLQSCKNKHNINAVILNTHMAYPAFSFYKKVGFDIVDDYCILARYI